MIEVKENMPSFSSSHCRIIGSCWKYSRTLFFVMNQTKWASPLQDRFDWSLRLCFTNFFDILTFLWNANILKWSSVSHRLEFTSCFSSDSTVIRVTCSDGNGLVTAGCITGSIELCGLISDAMLTTALSGDVITSKRDTFRRIGTDGTWITGSCNCGTTGGGAWIETVTGLSTGRKTNFSFSWFSSSLN